MSRDVCIDDEDMIMASETGSTSSVPQQTGQLELLHLMVDPSGRSRLPSASLTRRKLPNTQWSMLEKKSMKTSGSCKKKGVNPSITAL